MPAGFQLGSRLVPIGPSWVRAWFQLGSRWVPACFIIIIIIITIIIVIIRRRIKFGPADALWPSGRVQLIAASHDVTHAKLENILFSLCEFTFLDSFETVIVQSYSDYTVQFPKGSQSHAIMQKSVFSKLFGNPKPLL